MKITQDPFKYEGQDIDDEPVIDWRTAFSNTPPLETEEDTKNKALKSLLDGHSTFCVIDTGTNSYSEFTIGTYGGEFGRTFIPILVLKGQFSWPADDLARTLRDCTKEQAQACIHSGVKWTVF
jgi:hypothetical protein